MHYKDNLLYCNNLIMCNMPGGRDVTMARDRVSQEPWGYFVQFLLSILFSIGCRYHWFHVAHSII